RSKRDWSSDVCSSDLMDTQSRFPNEVYGDTLYIAFNGISNRSTDYFVAAGDSVTITAYGTTESATILQFKAALWELSDDQTRTRSEERRVGKAGADRG